MKETKRQRKLRKGMNSATLEAYTKGHKPPVYKNITPPNQPEVFAKVGKGVPYVNPKKFGM